MSSIKNPYSQIRIYFEPENFYGSRALIDELMEGFSAFPQPKSFELVGLPGMGKTTLLRYLAHPEGPLTNPEYRERMSEPFRNRHYKFFPVHVEFRHIPSQMDALVFLYLRFSEEYQRYRELMRTLEIEFEIDEDSRPEVYIRSLEKSCDLLNRSGVRSVFLLDDFDIPFKQWSSSETTRLRPFRDSVAFVLATEQAIDQVNQEAAGSPFFYEMKVINFKGLEPEDAEWLVKDPAMRRGYAFPKSDRKIILEHAGRHPALLFRGCEALWDLRLTLDLKSDVPLSDKYKDVLIGRMKTEFLQAFRLYWYRLNDNEQSALGSLARYPDQITSVELKTIDLLEQYSGLVIYEPTKDQYDFFSPLFAEFVHDMTEKVSGYPPVVLTDLETKLFEYLRDHSDRVCTFEELNEFIWEEPMEGKSKKSRERARRRVQVAISRLRNKLRESTKGEIISVRDEGYRLIPRTTSQVS